MRFGMRKKRMIRIYGIRFFNDLWYLYRLLLSRYNYSMRVTTVCRNKILRILRTLLILFFSIYVTSSCSFIYNPEKPPESGNIILLIGDGMGFAQVRAASLFETGTEVGLSFQAFPIQAEVKTAAFGGVVTDSAAAATAIATGHKVINGVISKVLLGDLETLLEYYKRFGKRVGLVSTAHITHATPAAFGAHNLDRSNYEDIASDYLTQSRPHVLFGGGGKGMSQEEAVSAEYDVVETFAELAEIDPDTAEFVSGQFGDGHLPYSFDGLGSLPALHQMTEKALEILEKDTDGFFLMVEAGRIDHASHGNDIIRTVYETIELSNTISIILDWAEGRTDTLVLLTADHETGGLAVTEETAIGVTPKVTWSSGGHTGANVPLYVWGKNAELFDVGILDNTDIYRKIIENY
jgi:alkaline phosphatase